MSGSPNVSTRGIERQAVTDLGALSGEQGHKNGRRARGPYRGERAGGMLGV
jgi:hypothetical protein